MATGWRGTKRERRRPVREDTWDDDELAHYASLDEEQWVTGRL